MSPRKYRLAAPIDNDTVIVSGQSTTMAVSSRLPRWNTSSSTSMLPNKGQTLEKTPSKPPTRWWLVLPCFLLITLASASDALLMNDLIVRRYKRRYGLPTFADANKAACLQSTTTTPSSNVRVAYWQFPPSNRILPRDQSDYDLVQRDAASFNVKNSIATLIPAVIIFILLGSNSDTIGRRPLLILPFFGKVIRYSLMLIIVSRDLSDAWLIAAHVLEAIFGSLGLVLLSTFAYITDCTNKSRTRAFLLTQVASVIARIIPVLGVSLWLRYHQYIVPLSVNLVLSMIGLLYALFVQPESVESVKNISLIRQLIRVRFKPIIHVITVFGVKRPGNARCWIMLLTIVTVLLLIILFGYTSVFPLYLYGHPFCLDAFNVGLISLAQAVTIFVASFLVILCKKTLNDTYLLPLLGTVALIVGLIILSVAKKLWLFYIGVCILSLFFVTLPVLRTKLTRLVEINEYAIVFIAAGIIETIGHEAVGVLANSIYKASLHFFPGLVFLVFGIVGVCPFVIISYLIFSETRKSRNTNASAATTNDAKPYLTSNRRSTQI